jgi:deoxycytidylate deaminase
MLSCSDVDKIATCYVTTSPCAHCLKMLMNTRCEAIIFRDEYPGNDHIGEWVSTGREWTCLK